jgi:hypothetical protein
MSAERHEPGLIRTDYGDDRQAVRRLERWSRPCPDSRPQRIGICLGYRESEPRRLQLRVALCRAEEVCDVIAREHEHEVRVRLLVCCDEDLLAQDDDPEYINVPVHEYLDKPLGQRTVIDAWVDRPVAVFVPSWC